MFDTRVKSRTNKRNAQLLSIRKEFPSKKMFVSELWRGETKILGFHNEYDDGLQHIVTDIFMELNKKLEELYIEMKKAGETLMDKVLITEENTIVKKWNIIT